MAGRNVGAHIFGDPLGAVYHLELTIRQQGFPVVGVKSSSGAFVGKAGFGQIQPLAKVTRLGEGRDEWAGCVIRRRPARCPTHVVAVEVGQNDNINIRWRVTELA